MVLIFGAATKLQNTATETNATPPAQGKTAPVPAPMQAPPCGGNPGLGKEKMNKEVESKSLGEVKSLGLSYVLEPGLKCDHLEVSWVLLVDYAEEGRALLRPLRNLFPFPTYRTSDVYSLKFGGCGMVVKSPTGVRLAKFLVRPKIFNLAKLKHAEVQGLKNIPNLKKAHGKAVCIILTCEFSPAVLAGYKACGKDYDADVAEGLTQLLQHPQVVETLPLVHRCDIALDIPGELKNVLLLQSSVQGVLKKNGHNAYYLNMIRAICITLAYYKTLQLWDVHKLLLPMQLTRVEQRQKFAPPIHLQRLLPALRALSRTTAYDREQALALMLASPSPHIRKLAMLRDWEQMYFRFAHDAHKALDKYQYAKLLNTLKPALVPVWGQCADYQTFLTKQFGDLRTMQAIAAGYGGKFGGGD
jgi:hypothetical protein